MTTIAAENAKQIRRSMDVQVTMQVPDTGTTLTFSGYSSSAKVADGVLNQQTWPMRTLADLQGDGFALNGSAALYDPNVAASRARGKLGVRGNAGQTVSITVTGSRIFAGLTALVTGAASVTYNGTTSSISAGRIVIPVGARSITLTFNPAAADTRIEVSDIIPGVIIVADNESIISCVVSLRSDLSPFDQTLPESELNLEMYNDADISDVVARIPDDTPITYTAGYDGDMSEERSFYVSGQITWEDNVLSIHAVDAVHFLDDIEFVAPVMDDDSNHFMNAVLYLLDRAGIDPRDRTTINWSRDDQRWIIREGTSGRDFIAFLNQTFNLTDKNGNLLDGTGALAGVLQFAYVDAGIPYLTTRSSDRGQFDIYEEDCADIKWHTDRMPGAVSANYDAITNPTMHEGDEWYSQKVGTATMTKAVGTSLSFEKYTYEWIIGLYLGKNKDNDVATKMLNKYGQVGWAYSTLAVVPANSAGWEMGNPVSILDPLWVGDKLPIGEIPQEEYRNYKPEDDDRTYYSCFVPWATPYDDWSYDSNPNHRIKTAAQMWNVLTAAKIIQSNTQVIDLDIYGCAFNTQKTVYTDRVNDIGGEYVFDELPVIGRISATTAANRGALIYPNRMLSVGLYRSPVTGSFTWKGDPRMQPRDIVHFHRLDGTVEDITLENITISHEGGGTSAEITYRKGVI